jgi:hypothetical protein
MLLYYKIYKCFSICPPPLGEIGLLAWAGVIYKLCRLNFGKTVYPEGKNNMLCHIFKWFISFYCQKLRRILCYLLWRPVRVPGNKTQNVRSSLLLGALRFNVPSLSKQFINCSLEFPTLVFVSVEVSACRFLQVNYVDFCGSLYWPVYLSNFRGSGLSLWPHLSDESRKSRFFSICSCFFHLLLGWTEDSVHARSEVFKVTF